MADVTNPILFTIETGRTAELGLLLSERLMRHRAAHYTNTPATRPSIMAIVFAERATKPEGQKVFVGAFMI